jgi:hypothetical protein
MITCSGMPVTSVWSMLESRVILVILMGEAVSGSILRSPWSVERFHSMSSLMLPTTADDHTDRHVRRVSLLNARIRDDSCHLPVWGWWIRSHSEFVSICLGDWCQRGKWSIFGVIIIIPSGLAWPVAWCSGWFLTFLLCENGGYVVTRSSCPSASATAVSVGNGPPLVLSSSLPAWLDQWPWFVRGE